MKLPTRKSADMPALADTTAEQDKPQGERRSIKCSFCGKSQAKVRKIIAGPGVYICDECIDLCVEIIEEETDLSHYVKHRIIWFAISATDETIDDVIGELRNMDLDGQVAKERDEHIQTLQAILGRRKIKGLLEGYEDS